MPTKTFTSLLQVIINTYAHNNMFVLFFYMRVMFADKYNGEERLL